MAQPKIAKIWYFTRLQLERMGEKVLDKQGELRKAVTMQQEFVSKLPEGTKFFHPLPRDARHPVLPYWLDNTDLNGAMLSCVRSEGVLCMPRCSRIVPEPGLSRLLECRPTWAQIGQHPLDLGQICPTPG